MSQSILKLVTVGTVSKEKNPIDFVRLLQQNGFERMNLEYHIIGKALDDTGDILQSIIRHVPNITYTDRYVTPTEYGETLISADIVVIPYGEAYTKYLTSGVMWDCFELAKPILCPNIELFHYYISHYKIGFLYDQTSLHALLQTFIKESNLLFKTIDDSYAVLHRENNLTNISERFSTYLEKLRKI